MQKQSKLMAAIVFKHDFLGKYPTKQKMKTGKKVIVYSHLFFGRECSESRNL